MQFYFFFIFWYESSLNLIASTSLGFISTAIYPIFILLAIIFCVKILLTMYFILNNSKQKIVYLIDFYAGSENVECKSYQVG
jgi:hypothetical protein